MTVEIPVSADLDLAGLNQKLAQFTRSLNSMGEQIARAGRVQFQPINRATLDMARQYETTIKNIARLAPELHRRLKATGQEQTPPEHWQWERLYGDPGQRLRAQRNLFTLATGISFSPSAPALAAGGAHGGVRPPIAIGGGLANAAETILRGGGTVGGLAAGALHSGRVGAMGGGIMGGIGAGLGFLAVQGIATAGRAVMARVSAAEQERIGYADLYARMGGRYSNASPLSIQGRGAFFGQGYGLREASRAISVTYPEALELGAMAARRGNITNAAELTGAVAQGGGFARSFGFDPSAGVSAFAGLRGAGVVRDTAEANRLGLAIAAGIARAGVFAKAEDYLADIASYGETTARSSLQATNLDAYNAALSGLAGMRIPGLDVRGAGNLLQQADASLRQGGAAGEASQAFLYRVLGTENGRMSPIAAETLQQGGLFATNRSIFGDGTVAGDFYRANGIAMPDTADPRTNLERVMDGLRSRYGNQPELFSHVIGRMFGTNYAQSMALQGLTPQQMRGIGELGISPETVARMSATGVATMGQIATADRPGLNRIAGELIGRTGNGALTEDERRRLAAARGGSDEDFRKVLAELQASRDQEQTDGQRIRSGVQDVEKVLTQLADGIVDPIQTMRDGILALVRSANPGNAGIGTAGGVREAQRRADIAALDEAEQAAVRAAQAPFDQEASGLAERHRRAAQAMREAQARGDTGAFQAAEAEVAAVTARRNELRQQRDDAIAAARAPFSAQRDSINRRYNPPTTPRGDGTLAPLPAIGGPDAARLERERFNEMVRPYAQRAADQLGVPLETVLGHWSLETRAGRSFAGRNNLGNITAGRNEDATEGADTDAQGRPIRQRFRNFNSLDEFADAYADWVRRKAPSAMGEQDPRAYAQRLHAASYATAPHFPNAVANVAGQYRGLPGAQATPAPQGAQATPLPAGAPADTVTAAGGPAQVEVRLNAQASVSGVLEQRDPMGRPAGPPVPLTGTFDAPRAYGAQRLRVLQ